MTALQGFTARASVPMVCSLIVDFSPLITLRDLVARQWCDPQSPKLIIRASEIYFFPFLMLLFLVAMKCHHDSATTASPRLDLRAQAPVYDTEHSIRLAYPTSSDLVLQFQLGSIPSTRTERLSKPTFGSTTIPPANSLRLPNPTTRRTQSTHLI